MSNLRCLVVIYKVLVYSWFIGGMVMIYPSIDALLQKIESKYLLVNIASRRAKEMDETGYYQMKENEYKSSKNIGRALEEVNKGLIHIKKN